MIINEYSFCDDCVNFLMIGDLYLQDLLIEEEETGIRVKKGVFELLNGQDLYVIENDGFRHSTCDCCNAEAGNRHIVEGKKL